MFLVLENIKKKTFECLETKSNQILWKFFLLIWVLFYKELQVNIFSFVKEQ